MVLLKVFLLLLLSVCLNDSYYCPEHHRHVGNRHVLRLVGDTGGGGWVHSQDTPLPTPQYWAVEDTDRYSEV